MIIRARYALLAPGEVRRDVRVELDGPRIAAISSGFSPVAARPDYDFGTAVIVPGLANPHAHLELEFCSGRVPFNGEFMDWLQTIRDIKRDNGGCATAYPEATLRQMAACGCTTVLDHHTTDLDWERVEGYGLRYVPFREFFQFDNHTPSLERMRSQARLGFAPHAPYTASLEVAQACRLLADEARQPLSMHLSEIRDEIAFIRDGKSAAIEKLLAMAQAGDREWRGCGKSPVKYFADLGLLSGPTYCVHVNYLEPGDLDILAALKPTVVFCPRSHAFFHHAPHPIRQYLAAGVPVALGTDSLGSNDRLSPLHEAALVRQSYPDVASEDLFAAITTRALAPLGWTGYLGKLEPGYLADLAVFELPGDPLAYVRRGAEFPALFDAVIAAQQARLTVCRGRVIHPQNAASIEQLHAA
jgi:cytosine/adenosine deaminase-related metal-dependent hydrolase